MNSGFPSKCIHWPILCKDRSKHMQWTDLTLFWKFCLSRPEFTLKTLCTEGYICIWSRVTSYFCLQLCWLTYAAVYVLLFSVTIKLVFCTQDLVPSNLKMSFYIFFNYLISYWFTNRYALQDLKNIYISLLLCVFLASNWLSANKTNE